MWKMLWRVARQRGYVRAMGQPTWKAEPQPADLKRFVGCWVAVKDGRVLAAAANARELVPRLHELGDVGRGAVAQFVPEPSDSIMIGVG